jgi:hypothetical protein
MVCKVSIAKKDCRFLPSAYEYAKRAATGDFNVAPANERAMNAFSGTDQGCVNKGCVARVFFVSVFYEHPYVVHTQCAVMVISHVNEEHLERENNAPRPQKWSHF